MEATTTLVAADSTGLDSGRRSEYFGRRCGQKKLDFPKVSQIVDTDSHVALAAISERGPGPDDPSFHALARQAHRRQPFRAIAADAGYDGEPHHQFLCRELGVIGIMPPRRGRPMLTPGKPPQGFFRGFLFRNWPKKLYGRRWQVETRFSMEKRKLGSSLRSRRYDAQAAEMQLRVITLNLMLEPTG